MQIIQCGTGQSVFQAAIEAGFKPPDFRVGIVPNARNLPWEKPEPIARVKANRYSPQGYPIFERIEKIKEDQNGRVAEGMGE